MATAESLTKRLDWAKGGGLLPAIVQHFDTGAVLMLGYMNEASLSRSMATGRVTFYSRSRQSLWEKGETSGNVLELVNVQADCDADAILVEARPTGPVCHTGLASCFGEGMSAFAFLGELETIIRERLSNGSAGSYTARLADAGVPRVAQKIGEEAVELALAAVSEDDDAMMGEAADLVYHLLVLLAVRGKRLGDVAGVLARRHRE